MSTSSKDKSTLRTQSFAIPLSESLVSDQSPPISLPEPKKPPTIRTPHGSKSVRVQTDPVGPDRLDPPRSSKRTVSELSGNGSGEIRDEDELTREVRQPSSLITGKPLSPQRDPTAKVIIPPPISSEVGQSRTGSKLVSDVTPPVLPTPAKDLKWQPIPAPEDDKPSTYYGSLLDCQYAIDPATNYVRLRFKDSDHPGSKQDDAFIDYTIKPNRSDLALDFRTDQTQIERAQKLAQRCARAIKVVNESCTPGTFSTLGLGVGKTTFLDGKPAVFKAEGNGSFMRGPQDHQTEISFNAAHFKWLKEKAKRDYDECRAEGEVQYQLHMLFDGMKIDGPDVTVLRTPKVTPVTEMPDTEDEPEEVLIKQQHE